MDKITSQETVAIDEEEERIRKMIRIMESFLVENLRELDEMRKQGRILDMRVIKERAEKTIMNIIKASLDRVGVKRQLATPQSLTLVDARTMVTEDILKLPHHEGVNEAYRKGYMEGFQDAQKEFRGHENDKEG